MVSIDTLSQIAMERASSSREAVELIGKVAEQYGFYGATDSIEGGGESLIIADPSEGWVFQILPDDTGTSAIWAAQRVPDDHATVVANMFTIRNVYLNDTANFLGSANLYSIALKKGWIKEGDILDFTRIYSDGEYGHLYYSGRRMWRAFDLMAPSLALPANYSDLKYDAVYPFSVKPDKKMTLNDVFNIFRDYLEGTAFDMTKGLAAGAFGSPDRWAGGEGERSVKGNWERPIAMYRTSCSYVSQLRSWLNNAVGGITWYGPHAAHGTFYAPFAAGMLSLPYTHTHGVQAIQDLDTAFYAIRYVFNIAQFKFQYLIADIKAAQLEWEKRGTDAVNRADALGDQDRTRITEIFETHARDATAGWWKLFHTLMFKYADGFVNTVNANGAFSPTGVGYPAWYVQGNCIQNDTCVCVGCFPAWRVMCACVRAYVHRLYTSHVYIVYASHQVAGESWLPERPAAPSSSSFSLELRSVCPNLGTRIKSLTHFWIPKHRWN